MKLEGNLSKLLITCDKEGAAQYSLKLGDKEETLNDKLGQKITLTFQGAINCVTCQAPLKKTYNNGSCYKCFITLAQNDHCIFKPETCHFHLGTCRQTVWGEKNCFREHCLYLSNSSQLKVGITKYYKRINRWLDQGASQGIVLATVKNRIQSGLLEVFLKDFLQDKTNWRKMLQGKPELLDLKEIAKEYKNKICQEFNFAKISEDEPVSLSYPVEKYPEKVSSYSFDKQPKIEDCLMGIKGQYLILEKGVINLKKFSGYFVSIEI